MDFFDTLIRYETDLWNHLDRQLVAAGAPTLAVLSALRVVAKHDGHGRVAELQEDLRITVGAASKLADRLERDGFIDRRPHPDDRRSSILTLTNAGLARHESGVAVLTAAMRDHGTGLADELAATRGTLATLSQRLESGARR